jgi:hypothetical protein
LVYQTQGTIDHDDTSVWAMDGPRAKQKRVSSLQVLTSVMRKQTTFGTYNSWLRLCKSNQYEWNERSKIQEQQSDTSFAVIGPRSSRS